MAFSENVINANKHQLHNTSMDNGEDIDRGLKRARTPSPLDNWTKNNNQVSVVLCQVKTAL